MDDLYATFLPQFRASARTRIARALDAATKREYDKSAAVVSELHALTGEAGLLGLSTVVPLARDGEEKAKRMRITRTEGDAEALVAVLQELGRVIDLVAPAGQPDGEST